MGIDLNQIWFWKRIPRFQGEALQQSTDECLYLYTSSDTIIIRKILPQGETYISDQVALEEKDFEKLLQYLYEEFSYNLPE
jgi:regulator of sirC expression with transglutaminase-like and TPR domain